MEPESSEIKHKKCSCNQLGKYYREFIYLALVGVLSCLGKNSALSVVVFPLLLVAIYSVIAGCAIYNKTKNHLSEQGAFITQGLYARVYGKLFGLDPAGSALLALSTGISLLAYAAIQHDFIAQFQTEDGVFFGATAVVAAVVSAFYLWMLDRTKREGEAQIEKMRIAQQEFEKKASQLEEQVNLDQSLTSVQMKTLATLVEVLQNVVPTDGGRKKSIFTYEESEELELLAQFYVFERKLDGLLEQPQYFKSACQTVNIYYRELKSQLDKRVDQLNYNEFRPYFQSVLKRLESALITGHLTGQDKDQLCIIIRLLKSHLKSK